jgi:hypothetical protein
MCLRQAKQSDQPDPAHQVASRRDQQPHDNINDTVLGGPDPDESSP